jgi:hypothetical protein
VVALILIGQYSCLASLGLRDAHTENEEISLQIVRVSDWPMASVVGMTTIALNTVVSKSMVVCAVPTTLVIVKLVVPNVMVLGKEEEVAGIDIVGIIVGKLLEVGTTGVNRVVVVL